MPCHAMPCCAMLCCHALPCFTMPCHASPCQAAPCHTVSCCTTLCRAMPFTPRGLLGHQGAPLVFLGCVPGSVPSPPFGVPGAPPPRSTAPLSGHGAGEGREPCRTRSPPSTRSAAIPGGGSGNRWREEALGHHQLLLSLADDTECKFCWHCSLRLFCLCIPPVLITVIEL